jgi:hypothetical protein
MDDGANLFYQLTKEDNAAQISSPSPRRGLPVGSFLAMFLVL